MIKDLLIISDYYIVKLDKEWPLSRKSSRLIEKSKNFFLKTLSFYVTSAIDIFYAS